MRIASSQSRRSRSLGISGKKSRSMIFSIAATYVSSSRTFDCLVEGEGAVVLVVVVMPVDGEGEERWRGEFPGERSMVIAREPIYQFDCVYVYVCISMRDCRIGD